MQVGEPQQPSLRQFSRTVVTQLLQRFGQVTLMIPRPHSDTILDQVEARAYLDRLYMERLPPTGSKVGVARCYVCSHATRRPKARKSTCYRCHECQVPMCLVPCFRVYHTLIHY
ncbi:hypothetical protein Pcinc_000540 [Petrolisthes cinctipes]|uniref:PiggyBac transposable element-derived protein 4 C-terminal zinc-finger domain-containing protein n=1 Tax=Petrolisthes cinctipes TaxID=88211 RepID=A0AAE1GN64_PETCI|nr:hypothetical protein Pcinc_000540 [Petrolisthes cinctipes]